VTADSSALPGADREDGAHEMTDAAPVEAVALLADLTTSSVIAGALASALADERADTPSAALDVDDARAAVLRTLADPESVLRMLWEDRRARSNNLISTLSQAAAAAGGTTRSWSDLSDDVMIAQGRSSALMARVLLTAVAPAFGFVADRAPRRVLDVGTGIGAIATELARALPDAEITGIDIAERPLEIARARLLEVETGVARRVHLRREDVTELADRALYDVVWMPMPFLPDAVADRALERCTVALRPGGLLVLGTHPDADDQRVAVANAWLASLTGGGTLTTGAVAGRLEQRGFAGIARFGTVPGGPVLVAAIAPD
jgi:SAM-dependent methyltransferase